MVKSFRGACYMSEIYFKFMEGAGSGHGYIANAA